MRPAIMLDRDKRRFSSIFKEKIYAIFEPALEHSRPLRTIRPLVGMLSNHRAHNCTRWLLFSGGKKAFWECRTRVCRASTPAHTHTKFMASSRLLTITSSYKEKKVRSEF